MAKMKEVLVRIKQYFTKLENDKVDKVANATNNNIALFDSNGNVKDSGKSINDVGKVATVSVGGGTPIQPDQDKNIDLPAYPTRVSLQINNVNNTSDANKPVSTAQRTAIDSTGHKIDLEINNTNFKMVAKLYDKNNNLLSTSSEIDLPLESVVVGGSYDSVNKKVVLTLQNGTTIEFSVADLIYGLQSEITAQNPLSSDLVSDNGNAHKFVSENDKTNWNNKVDGGSLNIVLNTKTHLFARSQISKNYISENNTPIFKSGFNRSFIQKNWSGLTSFNGRDIWTDGENIYCSAGIGQYVLNKETSTWVEKTWIGLTSYEGNLVWTDGENIYFSKGTSQYKLDKATSTWTAITWSGTLTSFYGDKLWTDGENIYFSNTYSFQGDIGNFVLNVSTGEWSNKTWSGLSSFDGNKVWTDGENIYYSAGIGQYVLNKETSTWVEKTWYGLPNIAYFSGDNVWTDGENIYLSTTNYQYVLNKETSTWKKIAWENQPMSFNGGTTLWTDGENIYFSSSSDHYQLDKQVGKFLFEDSLSTKANVLTISDSATSISDYDYTKYLLNDAKKTIIVMGENLYVYQFCAFSSYYFVKPYISNVGVKHELTGHDRIIISGGSVHSITKDYYTPDFSNVVYIDKETQTIDSNSFNIIEDNEMPVIRCELESGIYEYYYKSNTDEANYYIFKCFTEQVNGESVVKQIAVSTEQDENENYPISYNEIPLSMRVVDLR